MSYPGAPQVHVGEVGRPVYYNTGTDLTVAKSLWVIGIRPDGTLFGGPAVIGVGFVWRPNQTMAPPNWCSYVLQPGDLNQAGWYTIDLWMYPSPPLEQIMQSNFTVAP